jgi:CheY-like chemotaxis protein
VIKEWGRARDVGSRAMARPRVLLVDDDRDIRDALREMLEVEGFDVETAVDGGDALDRLVTRPPDVLVTDLMMPVLDGWALVAEARRRRRFRRLPIVVITAHAGASAPGADRIVTKPFDIDHLLSAVREATESQRAQAQAATNWRSTNRR